MHNLPGFWAAMGGHFFSIRYISMVAFGRVFFHCHWIGDTIVGGSLGYALGEVFFLLQPGIYAQKGAEAIVGMF